MPTPTNEEVLKIDTNLTIQEIEQVFERLAEKVAGFDGDLSLDLSEVMEIDVTGFQIIFSSGKSLNDKGSNLSLKNLPSDHPVLIQARRLGLNIDEFFEPNRSL